MTKITSVLTTSQRLRLISCVKNKTILPRELRKKIYRITKRELKIGYTIVDTVQFIISREIGDYELDLSIFPIHELSEEAYDSFCDGDKFTDHWDSLNINAFKRRLDFLNNLLENVAI